MPFGIRILATAAFAGLQLFAQPFYAGVKGGVLLSSSKAESFTSDRSGETRTSMVLRRYSVGPSFEFGLPARLRLEAGLLYRSFDATRAHTIGQAAYDNTLLSDKRWETPVVLRRELGGGAARPYAGAGGRVAADLPRRAVRERAGAPAAAGPDQRAMERIRRPVRVGGNSGRAFPAADGTESHAGTAIHEVDGEALAAVAESGGFSAGDRVLT